MVEVTDAMVKAAMNEIMMLHGAGKTVSEQARQILEAALASPAEVVETPPPETHSGVLRDIKAEAYQRETVPSQSATKDAIRGAALALSARLGAIERMCRDSLKTPSPQPREDASHPPQQEPARLREEIERLEKALETAMQKAPNGWVTNCAGDMCSVETVSKAWERINKAGSTLSHKKEG